MLDVALGAATPENDQRRRFTSIERSMFVRVLSGAVTRITKSVGATAGNFTVAQDIDAFGNGRQGGDKAEAQRVCVTLAIESVAGSGTWKLYLPGLAGSARPTPRPEKPAPLPAHLADVRVELRARLGASEVPLSELLALEVGDVIPLSMSIGDPLRVLVEDQDCLRAALGRSQGKLAIQISHVERPKSES